MAAAHNFNIRLGFAVASWRYFRHENNIHLQKFKEKAKTLGTDGNESTQGVEKKEISDIIDIIGEDGIWQRKIFFIMLLTSIGMPWNHLGISFLAYPVDYWCARPPGVNISLQTWQNKFIPNVTINGEIRHSQCKMFLTDFADTNETILVPNHTVKCQSWEYSSDYHSVIDEWGMVCEKTWMLSMSQSIYMIGFLVAVSVTGQVSDLFGRRPTVLLNVLILQTAGIATAFSSSFTMFVILRCFVGLGQAGMDLAIFVIATEVFGPSCRATYLMLGNFSFVTGYSLLPLIAWLVADWFWLQLVFSLFSLSYICFFWCLPESPRWLLSVGQKEKTLSVLKSAVHQNRIVVSDMEEKLEIIHRSLEKKKIDGERTVTFVDLFKTPNLRKKTLYLFFIWITLAFTYYGLSFYSTELYGNKFLNFFFSALAEVPTCIYCQFTANRYGRKKMLFISVLVGGISCLGFIVIPKGYETVQNIMAMSGKLFVSGAFSIVYLFSAEIFPTVARNAGVGICSMVARIGSALSPFMRDLGQATSPSVPLVIFGVLCVISSLLLLKLPETSLRPIPETLKEAETTLQDTCTSQEKNIKK